jgi:uncharacterized membrane protein YtjA (UPF0391 family)
MPKALLSETSRPEMAYERRRMSPAVPVRRRLYDARPTEPNADVRVHGLGSRLRSSDPRDTLICPETLFIIALVLIAIALVAALFGFGGVASTATGGAHLLIWLAVVVVIAGVVFALLRRA